MEFNNGSAKVQKSNGFDDWWRAVAADFIRKFFDIINEGFEWKIRWAFKAFDEVKLKLKF